MSGGTLTLDNILSAAFHFTIKWSSDLQSNKARDLLRFLVSRLYDEGQGQLMNAQITLAQTTLAYKLGMSRQWVGALVQRLEAAGWIEHYSPKLPDGMNGATLFRIGNQFKRLLITLIKSKRGKTPIKVAAKERWHFSPSQQEKKIISILKKNAEPPKPELLTKAPLLKTWLERGKEYTSCR